MNKEVRSRCCEFATNRSRVSHEIVTNFRNNTSCSTNRQATGTMKHKILLAIAGLVLAHSFPLLVFADQTNLQKPTSAPEVSGEIGIYSGGRIVMTHKSGLGTEIVVYSQYDASGKVVEQQTLTTQDATGACSLEEFKRNAATRTVSKTRKLGSVDTEHVIAKH